LLRTHGEKATPPSQYLLEIFKRGDVLEQPVAVQQLIAAKWRVWDEQRTFYVVEKGKTLLSCRIDCLAKPPDSDQTYVTDHKVLNPYDWEKIPRGWDGYQFLRESPKPWLHSYPAQIMSYMYAHPGSAETGLLQLINALTLRSKFVYIPFDVDYMQEILDRAIRINGDVEQVELHGMRALPFPIDWDEAVCGRCPLLSVCLPDQLGRTPLELIDDDSFVELLEEDRDLNAKKGAIEKQYKLVHDRVKHMVGDRKQVAAGHFVITQKEIQYKEYTVAARVQVRMDIKDLNPKHVDADVEESA